MKKYYKIAGLTVEMDSFGRTERQAESYLTDFVGEADIVVENATREFCERYPEVPTDSCEYMFTGTSFYAGLVDFDGILLHSSAVVVDGRAYLFTAPCGTGKSTHTALYLSEFGERAYILNDDKPAIRLEDGVFYAYGTPWSGKNDLHKNARAPIAGICILNRAEKNEISRIGGREAILGIYSQTLRPLSAKHMEKVLSTIEKIIETIPIWSLRCNMNPEAARLSYEAMSRH